MLLLDVFGAVLSILCTYLLMKANRLGWLFGLGANIINLLLFCKSKLYADSLLEIVFFLTGLYGWFYWYSKEQDTTLSIQTLPKKTWAYLGAFTIAAIALSYYQLLQTDSNTPVLDSVSAILSIVAQYLLTYCYLETWYFWFVADLLYVILYAIKSLPFHAIIMCTYLGFAVKGLIDWKKLSLQQGRINYASLVTNDRISAKTQEYPS